MDFLSPFASGLRRGGSFYDITARRRRAVKKIASDDESAPSLEAERFHALSAPGSPAVCPDPGPPGAPAPGGGLIGGHPSPPAASRDGGRAGTVLRRAPPFRRKTQISDQGVRRGTLRPGGGSFSPDLRTAYRGNLKSALKTCRQFLRVRAGFQDSFSLMWQDSTGRECALLLRKSPKGS